MNVLVTELRTTRCHLCSKDMLLSIIFTTPKTLICFSTISLNKSVIKCFNESILYVFIIIIINIVYEIGQVKYCFYLFLNEKCQTFK